MTKLWSIVLSGTVLIGILTNLVTIFVTVPANRRQAIHGESNWRSELLKLCYVNEVKDEEILHLRALVSPYPHKREKGLDNLIIGYCKKYYGKNVNDKSLQAREFRLLARTLLKYDWNYSQHNRLWAKYKNKQLFKKLSIALGESKVQEFLRNAR